MNIDAHTKQQQIWDKEHQQPHILLQMDSKEGSSGVKLFCDFLKNTNRRNLTGLEFGCGKGRNVIHMAQQDYIDHMSGFDFSPHAITTAKERAQEQGLDQKTTFVVADATQTWPYDTESLDFIIDCFASTDIESPQGRSTAITEMHRILKPGGLVCVYALSPEDEFHAMMIKQNPAEEPNALYHETGKFEKTFSESELKSMYVDWNILEWKRIPKQAHFFGKEYACNHFWIVLQKHM
jgi:ubiquinone/menaquinone biosynthesis C-methylase UbiE